MMTNTVVPLKGMTATVSIYFSFGTKCVYGFSQLAHFSQKYLCKLFEQTKRK